MPRKPRVEYAGAVYHVMSRGNHQEPIYADDQDCEIFLDTLDEACRRCGWRVHAFVLMGNHYHMLLETPEANLVAGMKWLQGTYTQRHNARHKKWGHLLQGRYKALLVDGDVGDYFLTVSNYIHLNPARAQTFDLEHGRLQDHRWSSYPLYMRPSRRPDWLVVDRTLGNLGLLDTPSGRSTFSQIMQKRVLELARAKNPKEFDPRWAKIRRGWCFGSEQFVGEMKEHLRQLSGNRESFSGEEARLHDEVEAERLFKAGLKVLGLDEGGLLELRKGADEKALLAWLIRRNTAVSNRWIAERLQMGRADCLSRYPRRIEESKDPLICNLKKKLKGITRLRD